MKPEGNLLSRQDALKGLTETFSYDNLNRLTASAVNGTPQLALSYDGTPSFSKGNIASKTDAGEYVYKTAKQELKEGMEFQPVEALYPNPTTGKFSITFSKALKGASLTLSDLRGKTVLQFKASGHKVDFDLSKLAAGVYLVRIGEGKNSITKKVVKL